MQTPFYNFRREYFIFCTMIANGVRMTTTVTGCQHDLGFEYQGPTYITLGCNTNSSYIIDVGYLYLTQCSPEVCDKKAFGILVGSGVVLDCIDS